MSNESITAAITHAAEAQGFIDNAISNLFTALRNVNSAAESLKNANAYVSDGNSEATAARLKTVMTLRDVVAFATELQGIDENLADHLSSLRGELEAPGSQF